MTKQIQLGREQTLAFDKIMAWHKTDEKSFSLAGFAGTGKSTLAKHIADEIGEDNVVFCAYTGKAANVLREKGCKESSTVHGAIYRLVDPESPRPRFILNEDSVICDKDLVIVDEYSMLPTKIIDDLQKLGKKILYLGDPYQLPPVQGECPIMPDFFLEEIHRQALESPIIRYATDVRSGRSLQFCDLPEMVYAPRSKVASSVYEDADQIIVGRNATRSSWNARFRQKKGFSHSIYPVKGDKIICTKNNHEKGLFNGMIGYCENDTSLDEEQVLLIDFEDHKEIKTWDGNFRGDNVPLDWCRRLDRFDFAYAITCHKSQGSEFDHAVIYNEPVGSSDLDCRRWLYTAITRGKQKVTLVEPK